MPQSDARRILNNRFAAGDITEEEYDRIRARLDARDATAQHTASRRQSFTDAREEATQPAASSRDEEFTEDQPEKGSNFVLLGVLLFMFVGGLSAFIAGYQNPPQNSQVVQRQASQPTLLTDKYPLTESDLDNYVTATNRYAGRSENNRRFESVDRVGRILVFNFTMLDRSFVATTGLIEQERRKIARTFCDDPQERKVIFSTVRITSNTYYEDGRAALIYNISSNDCR